VAARKQTRTAKPRAKPKPKPKRHAKRMTRADEHALAVVTLLAAQLRELTLSPARLLQRSFEDAVPDVASDLARVLFAAGVPRQVTFSTVTKAFTDRTVEVARIALERMRARSTLGDVALPPAAVRLLGVDEHARTLAELSDHAAWHDQQMFPHGVPESVSIDEMIAACRRGMDEAIREVEEQVPLGAQLTPSGVGALNTLITTCSRVAKIMGSALSGPGRDTLWLDAHLDHWASAHKFLTDI
jgi:hypothetical protein